MQLRYESKIKILRTIIILFMFFVFFVITTNAFAYVPLEPSIVGVESKVDVNAASYIKKIYQIGIGVAGALAVLMIVIGGIEYTASMGNPGKIGAARARIWAAIGGLVLAFFSFIILNTINPNLVKFNLELEKVDIEISGSRPTKEQQEIADKANKKINELTKKQEACENQFTDDVNKCIGVKEPCNENAAQKYENCKKGILQEEEKEEEDLRVSGLQTKGIFNIDNSSGN